MTDMKKKLAAGVAAGALLLQFAAPVLGATYTISGNGRESTSLVEVNHDRDVDVDQDNDANIVNNVTISANTGGNRVSDTTGGEVHVDTGNTAVGVAIENRANLNAAQVESCGNCGLEGEYKIIGNARETNNTIEVNNDTDIDVDQDNDANIRNNVNVTASSGRNRVADTGMGGDVTIDTGNVVVNPIRILNRANANFAMVAGAGDEGGDTLLRIVGNARESRSFIDVDADYDVDVDQDNDANMANDVNVAAFSGGNRVLDAMSGMVEIDTGDIEVGAMIDNMANFNWADVEECCFLGDLEAEVSANGRESGNTIELDFDEDVDVDQDNDFDCGRFGYNPKGPLAMLMGRGGDGGNCADVDVTAKTGWNTISDTLGDIDGDPSVDTGDAEVGVAVSNSANMQVFGATLDFDFEEVLDLLEDLFEVFRI